MFKKLMSAVAAAALCVSLAACGATATSEAAAEATATPAPAVTEAPGEETASAETADGALRVAGLKGPTTMGLVNLMAGEDAADYDIIARVRKIMTLKCTARPMKSCRSW